MSKFTYRIDEAGRQVVILAGESHVEWAARSFVTLGSGRPGGTLRQLAESGDPFAITLMIARDELIERGLISG